MAKLDAEASSLISNQMKFKFFGIIFSYVYCCCRIKWFWLFKKTERKKFRKPSGIFFDSRDIFSLSVKHWIEAFIILRIIILLFIFRFQSYGMRSHWFALLYFFLHMFLLNIIKHKKSRNLSVLCGCAWHNDGKMICCFF